MPSFRTIFLLAATALAALSSAAPTLAPTSNAAAQNDAKVAASDLDGSYADLSKRIGTVSEIVSLLSLVSGGALPGLPAVKRLEKAGNDDDGDERTHAEFTHTHLSRQDPTTEVTSLLNQIVALLQQLLQQLQKVLASAAGAAGGGAASGVTGSVSGLTGSGSPASALSNLGSALPGGLPVKRLEQAGNDDNGIEHTHLPRQDPTAAVTGILNQLVALIQQLLAAITGAAGGGGSSPLSALTGSLPAVRRTTLPTSLIISLLQQILDLFNSILPPGVKLNLVGSDTASGTSGSASSSPLAPLLGSGSGSSTPASSSGTTNPLGGVTSSSSSGSSPLSSLGLRDVEDTSINPSSLLDVIYGVDHAVSGNSAPQTVENSD